MSTTLSFRFSGKIARLLGRESVSNNIIALFELIKNSYDADASNVEIIFENAGKPNGKITIKDDGRGMTFSDFRDRWMIVGTESKEREKRSKKGRRVVGEKGIGRFATEKLARKVTLISNPVVEEETITVNVNWAEYEKEGALFDEIKNPVTIQPRKKEGKAGLEVILEDLTAKWDNNMIMNLEKEIGKLVLPSGFAHPELEFNVTITASEFKMHRKPIESRILKMAPYRMTATMTEGILHCVIFEKKERFEREPHSFNRKPQCGPIGFELYVFPQDAPNEYSWTKYYENNIRGDDINNFLREYSGIRIYRDGFWIKPYGGKGNDWLELDKMRVTRYTNVGNGQVVGFVKISSDTNPDIKDTTTRERLIDNQAFQDMTEIIQRAVKEFNAFRNERRAAEREMEAKIPKDTLAVNNLVTAKKIVEKLPIENFEKNELIRNLRSAQTNITDFAADRISESNEINTALISQKNLVTLAIATSYVAHEVIRPLDDITKTLERLDSFSEDEIVGITKIKPHIKDLNFNASKVLHFMSFVNHYASLVSRSIQTRWQSTEVRVSDVFNRIVKAFKETVDDLGIEVIYMEVPDNITISINETDFESILTNLFTNSIKSLERMENERKIKMEVTFDKQKFVIKFSDNGIGIKSENRERIFEPLFSTYSSRDGMIKGTGLGLPIIKEILERYEGRISILQNTEYSRGVTFLIEIPLSHVPMVVS